VSRNGKKKRPPLMNLDLSKLPKKKLGREGGMGTAMYRGGKKAEKKYGL